MAWIMYDFRRLPRWLDADFRDKKNVAQKGWMIMGSSMIYYSN